MAGSAPKTVDAYIAAAPAAVRPKLRQLRATIRAAAPRATESISYQMPYYAYHGRLVYFAVQRAHVGLYMLGRAKTRYAKELAPYLFGASTARFPLDSRLPTALIRKVVAERVKENEERARSRTR
jgi:uncharacterized protein YdhG (YjbR/CyaY superfamily)